MKTNRDYLIEESVELSHLELGDTGSIYFENPFETKEFEDTANLPKHLLHLIRSKEYLHWFCQYILNIELLPIQICVLQELWTRPFPMLIATRGGAKTFILSVYTVCRAVLDQGARICVVGAALRQAMLLFNYIKKIWDESSVLQDICGGIKNGPKKELHTCTWKVGQSEVKFLPLGDGETIRGQRASIVITDEFSCLSKNTIVHTSQGMMRIGDVVENKQSVKLFTDKGVLESPSKLVRTPLVDTYEIKTRYGFTFGCSSIHQVMTKDGWKLAKDLTSDDWLLHENVYEYPSSYLNIKGLTINEDIGWLLGILLSEGCVTNDYTLSVHMTDRTIIQKLHDLYQKLGFSPSLYEKEAYLDDRGWNCKKSYTCNITNKLFRDFLEDIGLKKVTAHDKIVPWSILQSPKSVMISFLSGLFEGDGTACKFKDGKNRNCLSVAYYSVNKQLCQELQTIFHTLDIYGSLNRRDSKISENDQWSLVFRSNHAENVFKLLSVDKWKDLTDYFIHPENPDEGVIRVLSKNKDKYFWQARPYEMGQNKYIGQYETKEEALEAYATYKKSFKQYLQVVSVTKLPEQEVLYDFCLPKAQCFYGNGFKQHNSVNPIIFETVVRGFAAVRSQGLVGAVKHRANQKVLRDLNSTEVLPDRVITSTNLGCNQIIIAGTTSFQFNHFYKYYSYYKAIIESNGDREYLKRNYPDMNISSDVNPADYCIMRLPYDLFPAGWMDEAILAQGRATMNSTIFDQEYGCIFPSDSNGFYPASSIHNCTCPVIMADGKEFQFFASLHGDHNLVSVMGVDPASESDNFAINILQMNGPHRHNLYQWTTNRKRFNEMRDKGLVKEDINDYHTFCIKHIRSLLKRFNVVRIYCDQGGGGLSIKEGLKDQDKFLAGDRAIYDMDDEEEIGRDGAYMLRMVKFTDSEWYKASHYGLKKDLADRRILFPIFDTVAAAEAEYDEEIKYENLEDLNYEIEELKREMILIKHDQSSMGTERWDVPKLKVHGGAGGEELKKELKKDRFTSLLLSNWGAREIEAEMMNTSPYEVIGIARGQKTKASNKENIQYMGPGARKLRYLTGDSFQNYQSFQR